MRVRGLIATGDIPSARKEIDMAHSLTPASAGLAGYVGSIEPGTQWKPTPYSTGWRQCCKAASIGIPAPPNYTPATRDCARYATADWTRRSGTPIRLFGWTPATPNIWAALPKSNSAAGSDRPQSKT